MNALGDRHLTVQLSDVHVRHTWACTTDGCANYENPWCANVGALFSDAATHARTTGHETIVITETRQVTNIKAEG